MAGKTIYDGMAPQQRASFAKTRQGQLIVVNGLGRGIIWDGIEGQPAKGLGIDPPTQAPTVSLTFDGGASEGTYLCAYRYVDRGSLHTSYSNLSPPLQLEADEGSAFLWTGYQASEQDRVTDVEFFRALPGAPNIYYRISTGGYGGRVFDSSQSAGKLVIYVESGHRLQVGTRITLSAGGFYPGEHRIATISGDYIFLETDWTGPAPITRWSLKEAGVDRLTDLELIQQATAGGVAGEDYLVVTNPDGSINANRFTPPPQDRPYVFILHDRAWYWGASYLDTGRVDVDYLAVSPMPGSTIQGGILRARGDGVTFTEALVGRRILLEGDDAARVIESVDEDSNTMLINHNDSSLRGTGRRYVIYPDASRRKQLEYSEVDEPESVPVGNTVTVQEQGTDDDRETGVFVHGNAAYLLMERQKYRLSFVRQARIDASIYPVDDRGALNNSCWAIYEGSVFLLDENGPYVFQGSRSEPIDQAIRDLWRDGTVDLAKRGQFHVAIDRLREKVFFFVAFVGDEGAYPTRALVFNLRRQTWDIYHYPLQVGAAIRATVGGTSRTILGCEADTLCLSDEGYVDVVGEEETPIAWTWKSRRITIPVSESQIDRSMQILFVPTAEDNAVYAQVWLDHSLVAERMYPLDNGRWAIVSDGGEEKVRFAIGREMVEHQQSQGVAEFNFAGRLDERSSATRHLVFELSGQQDGEQVRIEGINFTGVA